MNDLDLSVSHISQLNQQCEEIPEVPEEASSANITPRRLEEENEELAKMNEENRNASPLFGIVDKLEKIREHEKPLAEEENQYRISKFNIDKELELPESPDMDLSILSSLNTSHQENMILSPNNLSSSNISFTSGNFQNTNSNMKNPPKIPMLNLSKIKSPNAASRINFSLNLSAISENQNSQDASYTRKTQQEKRNWHQKSQQMVCHSTYDTTKTPSTACFVKKESRADRTMGDSFINDANMITDYITQPHHKRRISNLDLTFEKSDDKDDQENFLSSTHTSDKDSGFGASHWNFGSRRGKHSRVHKPSY